MSERPTVSVPAGIEEAQFEAWRRERKRGQRIPESLWATAVELAKQWGVWPTARALHLDHNRLKRRVRNGQDSEKSSAFVELISEGAMLCACRVEMEDGRGARMRRRHGVEPDVLERARMIAVSAQTRIWVARAPADFRCGIDGLSILNSDAAGIDIGAMEIYVAVPPDRDPEPVRMFTTFTEDLNALADWLQQCGVGTVAMESTGVYWVPLVQILATRGFETYLVKAKHAKNVPGRQTDVSDCQWLRHLHSVGLLRASFRPAQHVCAIRSLTRHRDNLIEMATCHVQHMQKALDQMNLQLHHVISDITGTTGLAILDAILAGERDAKKLADLRDPRIRATHETIAKSLVGDFRPEHLFTLRQSLAL